MFSNKRENFLVELMDRFYCTFKRFKQRPLYAPDYSKMDGSLLVFDHTEKGLVARSKKDMVDTPKKLDAKDIVLCVDPDEQFFVNIGREIFLYRHLLVHFCFWNFDTILKRIYILVVVLKSE